MIDVRPGAERHRGGEPGVETRHAFSFSGFYDPDNVRFGVLVACNEERLAGGAGFEEHTHRDTEILTWVIEGELEHRDAQGGVARLRTGDAQLLSSGGGVRHVERNGAENAPLRFLQMWIHPDAFGGAPAHTAVTAPAASGPGLTLLASGDPDASPPLRLRQRAAALHVGRPAAADRVVLPAAPFVYVHAVHGTLWLDGKELGPGDAARITGGQDVILRTTGPAEYLVWEMHAEPSYG